MNRMRKRVSVSRGVLFIFNYLGRHEHEKDGLSECERDTGLCWK